MLPTISPSLIEGPRFRCVWTRGRLLALGCLLACLSACMPEKRMITLPGGGTYEVETGGGQPLPAKKDGFVVESFSVASIGPDRARSREAFFLLKVAYPLTTRLKAIKVTSLADAASTMHFGVRDLPPGALPSNGAFWVVLPVFPRSRYPKVWDSFGRGESRWTGVEVAFFVEGSQEPVTLRQFGRIFDWQERRVLGGPALEAESKLKGSLQSRP